MGHSFATTGKNLIVIAVWGTIGWLVGFVRPLDTTLGIELPAWVRIPGVAAMLVGFAGVLGCGLMLSVVGIGTLPGKEHILPVEFLATGPFRFVRNPMSLAGVVLMAGIALWHRSTSGLGLAAALFVLFHLVIVRVEEPGLERRFGESYREYKCYVPRWIPRWHPWSRRRAEPAAPPNGGPALRPCDSGFDGGPPSVS
jgi:protein-S-isoprenylcysteine O-methyltransferase Ste14